MAIMHPKLLEVSVKDPRYTYEAYDFIFKALEHSETVLGRRGPGGAEPTSDGSRHFNSRELLEGIRALALREFGLMARTVFRMWGVRGTEDFGQIVSNLVNAGLITKSDDETLVDFQGAFDFEEALVRDYKIQLDEAR
jgi:uncharacterized repeat protein (TIGR04138 family)